MMIMMMIMMMMMMISKPTQLTDLLSICVCWDSLVSKKLHMWVQDTLGECYRHIDGFEERWTRFVASIGWGQWMAAKQWPVDNMDFWDALLAFIEDEMRACDLPPVAEASMMNLALFQIVKNDAQERKSEVAAFVLHWRLRNYLRKQLQSDLDPATHLEGQTFIWMDWQDRP